MTADMIGDIRFSNSPTGRLVKGVIGESGALDQDTVDRAFAQIVQHPSVRNLSELHAPLAAKKLNAGAAYKAAFGAANTLYADVSYYQRVVDFSKYPYWDLCIRSNDGTFRDPNFATNFALMKHALDVFGTVEAPNVSGLAMGGIYVVFRDNWDETVRTMESMLGVPHVRQWYMGDLESWNGALKGNKSAAFRSFLYAIAEYHAGHHGLTTEQALRRVWGYANQYDKVNLCPTWPAGIGYVLANYSSNDGPTHVAHQFGDAYNVAPFGPCDINSADNRTVAQLAALRGITLPQSSAPAFPADQEGTGDPVLDAIYLIVYGGGRGIYNSKNHPNVIKDLGAGGLNALIDWARKNGFKG